MRSLGRAATVNGISMLYDAFNRPVSIDNNGTFTQIIYADTTAGIINASLMVSV
jgi:hypothetical protein